MLENLWKWHLFKILQPFLNFILKSKLCQTWYIRVQMQRTDVEVILLLLLLIGYSFSVLFWSLQCSDHLWICSWPLCIHSVLYFEYCPNADDSLSFVYITHFSPDLQTCLLQLGARIAFKLNMSEQNTWSMFPNPSQTSSTPLLVFRISMKGIAPPCHWLTMVPQILPVESHCVYLQKHVQLYFSPPLLLPP